MDGLDGPLPFDAVVDRLVASLGFTPVSRLPSSRLYDEVGLDSADATELVLTVEAMAGHENPSVELPHMVTLGDVYDYYLMLVATRSG